METITVLTTTYNRSNKLANLYYSLYNQKEFDFKWLIVDDGSTDNTEFIVKQFKTDKFKIKYIYKKNGGKHTALNLAFNILDTELVIIVDSDDKLDVNAISQIKNDWKKYRNNINICGLVYTKKDSMGKLLCDTFQNEEFEANYNSYVINHEIKGDKAEVFKSSILKKYRYPEYEGEKFIGEGVLWSKIARQYNMVFINKSIYIADYLEDGLTKSGRKMRIKNPYGGMYHAEEYIDNIYKFKVKEKNIILYMVYARFAGINIVRLLKKRKYTILMLFNLIPSLLIYWIWKYKYK